MCERFISNALACQVVGGMGHTACLSPLDPWTPRVWTSSGPQSMQQPDVTILAHSTPTYNLIFNIIGSCCFTPQIYSCSATNIFWTFMIQQNWLLAGTTDVKAKINHSVLDIYKRAGMKNPKKHQYRLCCCGWNTVYENLCSPKYEKIYPLL